MVPEQRYDVIVIGGGSAGCAAAARLSEDSSRRVLLLEAGPDPQPLPDIVAAGRRQTNLLLESEYVWMYPTERKIDGSTFYALAGRIMGGGSSVNAMFAPRPTKYDFDTWTSLGNNGWTYEDCLPVLKRMENDVDFSDDPIHGSGGPIYIKRPWLLDMPKTEVVRAIMEQASNMGLPHCPDLNVANPFGMTVPPLNTKDGYRQSTTVAYLDPARGRPNLDVEADATVCELKLSGSRLECVIYEKDSQKVAAFADKVVLSAGVFHSPQILLLSGIGPEHALKEAGIGVRHSLPGVGENYQDHAVAYMTFEGRSEADYGGNDGSIAPRLLLMHKTDPDLPCGNTHLNMATGVAMEGLRRTMRVTLRLLQQGSRGRVSLASSDPHELPSVDPRLLEDPHDVEAILKAMQFVVDLTQAGAMEKFYGPLLLPGPQEDWAEFVRSTHDCYHHGCGTCMMGPASNPMAVVDDRLRLHGIDNLWVADASIMPTITHANTNLTAIMIGERVADFIRSLD